jgi:arylsulfatase A-like enzyme
MIQVIPHGRLHKRLREDRYLPKSFFRRSIKLTIFPLAFLYGELQAAMAVPPNLIVIVADDLGYADVGFNGHSDIPTPNIDRIAKAGVVFSDAYVTFTVCGPSRAGLITGRYPQRFGFERNPAWKPADPSVGLPLVEKTIAEVLRPAGYKSGVIGKWHLGAHESLHPLSRGFDEFYGHLGGGHRYFPDELTIQHTHDAKNEPQSYTTWISRGREPVRTQQYLTDEFSSEAVEFVSRHKDGPFFLYLAYNAPHGPLQAPQEEIEKFKNVTDEKRRIYSAMVSVMDRGIGDVLDELDKLGLTENTLIFFLSDNGGPTQSNGSKNTPLRGGKSDPFEGGFRVPMAARWPRALPAGIKYSKPVSALDILATIAAANNLKEDPQRPLDGVNLVPHLIGEKADAPHKRIYLRMFDAKSHAMREGDFKIIQPKQAKDEGLLLFNLASDLSEKNNLADTDQERLKSLQQNYEKWNAQLMEPAFRGLEMKEWKNAKP